MPTVHAVQPHTRLGRVTSSPFQLGRLALLVLLLGCEPKPDGEPTTAPVTESTCEGADALDRIWTASRHRELQAALATQPGEWPAQTLSTIDARVADGRETWRDTYAQACEQQDVNVQRCLDLEAGQLDALVATLLEDPARAALLWAEIDAVLRDVDACADTREPSFDAPPLAPDDLEGGLLALDEGLAAAREQSDPWLLFAALRKVGNVHIELRDHARAVPLLTEAVALSTRLAGSENPHTAEVQVSLASAVLALGQIEAAHDLLTQARDSFVNTLGPDHPQTLAVVASIAKLLVSAGRPFEANHAFLDLLEIYGELYGPKDARTARIKLELADTLMSMDEHGSARTFYLEALTPLVQALGADHRDVIRCAVHLGIAELALGNLEAAETHCRRSSDLVKALPADDSLRAEVGRCVEQLDKLAKAGKRKRDR